MAASHSTPRTNTDPLKNPSYPQRVHIRERAHWDGVLSTWKAKVADATRDYEAMPAGPAKAAKERMLGQMMGAVDQIRDAAGRLPMEVGHMYEEDKERLENAVEALERLFKTWK